MTELSTMSTTTSLSRIRGFTINLLYALKDGPLRVCELAEITGKPANYVGSYLYNMRLYGLVEKNEVFWNLTILGRDFISYLDRVSKYSIVIQKINKRRTKEIQKINKSSVFNKPKQIRIDLWLQNSSLDDLEKAVVEVLIEHYKKTGSKFIMVKDQYELAEKVNANPSDLPNALKNLRQDGIIYLFKDKTFGYWKVGLKKAFLEALSHE